MNERDTKSQRAKERASTIRGFYIHLGVYIAVNLLLFLINIIASPTNLWFFWPLLGWGIFIAIHAIVVFALGGLFGAEWEEKKIQEIMENEN